MSAIFVNQRVVHYEVLGRGRPVIFLHGWVGSWRYWISVMQTAAMACRTYALDLWGFGDTGKNHAEYQLENQLKLLTIFMDQMGISKAALVGHGLGGVVSMLFALRFPEMVDRLMVTACPFSISMINNRLRSQSPLELADWLVGKQVEKDTVRADAIKTDPLALSVSIEDLCHFNLEETLQAVKVPCLLAYGQNDTAIINSKLENLPDFSHAIYFYNSGHFPMLDESNKFNRLLVDFLALPSGEPPSQLQLKEEWKRRVR
jgi:pimeloyl-ACP methyl ester carboxylesterase